MDESSTPVIEAARTPTSNLAVSPPRGHYTLPAMAKSSLVSRWYYNPWNWAAPQSSSPPWEWQQERIPRQDRAHTARRAEGQASPKCARLVDLFRERDNRIGWGSKITAEMSFSIQFILVKNVHISILLSLLCMSQKSFCLNDQELLCHHPIKSASKYNWSSIIHDKVDSDTRTRCYRESKFIV